MRYRCYLRDSHWRRATRLFFVVCLTCSGAVAFGLFDVWSLWCLQATRQLFTGSSSLQHRFAAARTTDAALRVARAQHNSKSSSPLLSLENSTKSNVTLGATLQSNTQKTSRAPYQIILRLGLVSCVDEGSL